MALAAIALAVPVLAGGASAESTHQSPLIHGTPSSCATGENAGVKDGNVTVHRNKDGTVRVNLNIRNGPPNATYDVAITCERYIGSLTTNKAGNGAGTFTATTNGEVFGVDLAQFGGPDRYFTGPVLSTK